MGLFRIFQPHTDEYMLVWNSVVGVYTLRQLSDAKQAEVFQHYGVIVTLNHLDPIHDVTAHAAHDPFWLAFTMADLGIAPLLGPKSTKWFDVVNPRRARARLCELNLFEEIGSKVVRDIHSKHGILLTPDSLPLE